VSEPPTNDLEFRKRRLNAQDPFRELLNQHRRRLSVYLRALLPAKAQAETAFQETVSRLHQQIRQAPKTKFAQWSENIARQVALERRRHQNPLPFSDDLFRQLADTIGPLLDRLEHYHGQFAEILERLPPPEREFLRRRHELELTAEQIGLTEERPASVVSRDLTLLHATIVSSLNEEVPLGPPLPGGAMDLGRLSDQLLDGTINGDGRLILETLLLADAPSQAHYLRHVALECELNWRYRGEPGLPMATLNRHLSTREKWVTIAFATTFLVVLAFVTFVVGNRLNAW